MRRPFNYDMSSRQITELISLRGKTAVVIGAPRSLGYAVANRLAEAGAALVLADINVLNAEWAAQRIGEKYKSRVLCFPVDPADQGSLEELRAAASEALGKIDIWINYAGSFPYVKAIDGSGEGLEGTINKNVRSVFLGSRVAAGLMTEQGSGGVIINLLPGITDNRGYSAAEHLALQMDVRRLTQVFARELGSQGIRVLSVLPFSLQELRYGGSGSADPDESTDQNGGRPLGRKAIADDVARVVFFCASGLSMFMTGSVLTVDGGELCGPVG